ncbi:phospho-N-acetylmuramoyl-pentapeptide-transferase [uncultured Rubinisphaera sp.]|uniref:phospho-N-acetylmuramoyl-pentapeptide- transferase n=1 Tax=uncultured Rubinisphaera sp. TaxID=1678686 RepID=UPI0030DAE169
MVYWLLIHVLPFFQQVESHTTGTSRVYTTFRIALASLTSFLMAVCLGPMAIRWLKSRFRERVSSASSELDRLHACKNDTPTMGGLFLVMATLFSVMIWGNLENHYVQLSIFVILSFAMLGACDDWTKLSTSTHGLSARTKFVLQWILAMMAGASLYQHQSHIPLGTDLVSPVGQFAIPIGYGFIVWTGLVLVSASNGVNLTDGLDGLAGGCSIFAGGAMIAFCYLAGHKTLAEYFVIPYIPQAGETAVVVGAMVGAMLGFLWYNCHPAEVFMGDTGSLPMGAMLGLSAVIARQEFLFIIVGGIFVVEVLSVIIQISIYRTWGWRPLRCSPLHNHFVLNGQSEVKVVTRFWICGALLAIAAMAGLKIL